MKCSLKTGFTVVEVLLVTSLLGCLSLIVFWYAHGSVEYAHQTVLQHYAQTLNKHAELYKIHLRAGEPMALLPWSNVDEAILGLTSALPGTDLILLEDVYKTNPLLKCLIWEKENLKGGGRFHLVQKIKNNKNHEY